MLNECEMSNTEEGGKHSFSNRKVNLQNKPSKLIQAAFFHPSIHPSSKTILLLFCTAKNLRRQLG